MSSRSHQEPRSLAILGATGGTGQQLVQHALAAGYRVIAIVRNPTKIDLAHERLRIEVADVTDTSSLKPLLQQADAVLSALGPTGGDVCERAMTAVLGSLADPPNSRVVAISAQPVGRDDDGPAWWQRMILLPIIRLVYRRAYADLARMEDVLRASAAMWSVFRPPYLTDDPHNTYRLRVDATPSGNLSVARADLAMAMLDVLDDPTTYRRFLGIVSP